MSVCQVVRSSRLALSQDWSEEQFNVSEFKQVKIATHESSMNYQETSCDRLLFHDLVFRSFFFFAENQLVQVRDSGELFRCCSLFRSYSRANIFISRESDVTIIFRQIFRGSKKFISGFCSAASRTTSTSTTSSSQKESHWKAESLESRRHQSLRSTGSTLSKKVSSRSMRTPLTQ